MFYEADLVEGRITPRVNEHERDNLNCTPQIPNGAEACLSLVGVVEDLQKPIFTFVRLSESVIMEEVIAAPVPLRFIFILLGPTSAGFDYHEASHTISVLITNPCFKSVAYKAEDRIEILIALDVFLKGCRVLPPGYWKNGKHLSPAKLRARAEKKENKHIKQEQTLVPIEANNIPPKTSFDGLSRTGFFFGG